MRYFYRKGDRVSGPFDLERMRGALSRGSIDSETPVTPAIGSADEPAPDASWAPLRVAIPELFPRSTSSAARAAPHASAAQPVRVEFDAPRATRTQTGTLSVEVVNIRMDFWAMVVFMVKWVIASIPAAIILFLIVLVISATLGGAAAGIVGMLR